MADTQQPKALSQVLMLAAVAVVVAALYLAQDVLVPLALTFFFCFLLAPLVRRLERVGLGRVTAVVVVVALTSALLLGIGWVVTNQLISLSLELPQYRDNIRQKIQSLRGGEGGGWSRVAETITELREELSTRPTSAPATATAPAVIVGVEPDMGDPLQKTPRDSSPSILEFPGPPNGHASVENPVPVRIIEPSSSLQMLRETVEYLAAPLATAGIVIVLTIFSLIQREDLRDRLITIIGRSRVNVTTIAIDDAARRISRYLLMQLVINLTYGIPVAIGLYVIGVPSALLWGLLATLLRYLPYVGPWIAAVMPIALSFAVFDGWWHVLLVIGMFLVLELFSNNVMEPWLYGSSTGMSSVAVLVAAVFWTWLWGPIGLVLATPITACVVVMGKYIPQLEFLSILLGDEPAMKPEVRFYQRLLAMDQEEAEDLMEEYFEDRTLTQAYDEFLIPALHLAESDRHRNRIDAERQQFIYRTIRAIVEELGELKIESEREAVRSAAEGGELPAGMKEGLEEEGRAPRSLAHEFTIVCAPARDEADELAAMMFAQVLASKDFRAQYVGTSRLAGEIINDLRTMEADVVCISALPPGAVTHARYLCKRIHAQVPEIDVIVGLWNTRGNLNKAAERLRCAGAREVATSFADALAIVHRSAHRELLRG